MQMQTQPEVPSMEMSSSRWTEIREAIQERWTKLTEQDLEEIGGALHELEGRLQSRYGWAREEARDAVSHFLRSVKL